MRAYDEGFGDPLKGARTWLLVAVLVGLLASIACVSMTAFYTWGSWFFATIGSRTGIPLSIEAVLALVVVVIAYMSYRDETWLRAASWTSWALYIMAVYPISSIDWIESFTGTAVVSQGSAPPWALFALGLLLTMTVVVERCYSILDRTAEMLEARGANVDEIESAMSGALGFDLRNVAIAGSVATVAWVSVTLVGVVLRLTIAPVFGLLIAVGLLVAYLALASMDERMSV